MDQCLTRADIEDGLTSRRSRKSLRESQQQLDLNNNNDEEDEYQEEGSAGDEDVDNSDDTVEEEKLGDTRDEERFVASDSDDRPRLRRRGRPRKNFTNHRLQKSRVSLRRSANFRSSDGDNDIEEVSLQDELADLKESASPPRRKHLRERKAINYQILPPPPLDEPVITGVSGPGVPRKKVSGPIRQLFRTAGPFGGSDIVSIFGQNPHLKAAGGAWDSDSSDDEPAKALSGTVAIGAPPINGKNKIPDSDPLGIDTQVDFSAVGGLDSYIDQLKEMVSLPLMYPEVYQRFGVTPPRGVLFHGPPGTGKTLMARALAASCSSEGKKVTFFMRKGADCLSKWVGEAERQLRLLFEEAKNQQPSIIFFDEIDGLAPVRSSKQEQIHASIVSTLLALMDGMDNRGQVIVIGATNRPDSVDSALRRPGRFDREFYFPLPDLEARKKIISIHTRKWDPPLQESFIAHIARVTKGYGGADLRALCTEAALAAIQRRYPQIYQSKDKLLIDPATIHVSARDFMKSVEKIIPSSARSTSSNASPLPTHVEPLLSSVLTSLKNKVDNYIPRKKKMTPLEEAMLEDYDAEGGFTRLEATREFQTSRVFRPRLLVYGDTGMGQQYLGAAILHHLEGYHIQSFDLGTLLSDSTRTPEAMIIQLLVEVKRHTPSVIFIPNLDSWFETISHTARATFLSFLRDLKPTDSILVLALMEDEEANLDPQVNDLFGYSSENLHLIPKPSESARTKFFELLVKYIKSKPTDFPDPDNRPKRKLEELPVAPIVPEKDLTEVEQKQLKKRDMQMKNKLKIKLSVIMDPIKNRYKKFKKPIIDPIFLYHLFAGPSDTLQIQPRIPQQYERAENDMILETATGKRYYNMDLEVVEERLWNGYYSEPKEFLVDIKMIHSDSLTSGDRERIVKSSEMITNAQVYIDEISTDTIFLSECISMRRREKEGLLRVSQNKPAEPAEDGDVPATEQQQLQQLQLQQLQQLQLQLHHQQQQQQHQEEQQQQQAAVVQKRREEEVEVMHEINGVQKANGSAEAGGANGYYGARTTTTVTTTMTTLVDVIMEDRPASPGLGFGVGHYVTETVSQALPDVGLVSHSVPHFVPQASPQVLSQASSQALPHTLPRILPQLSPHTSPQVLPHALPHALPQALPQPSSGASVEDVSTALESKVSPHNVPSPSPPPKPLPPLVLSDELVAEFSTKLVSLTKNLSIERIEQVNSTLIDTLWSLRHEWDRNSIIVRLETKLEQIIGAISDSQEKQNVLNREALDVLERRAGKF